MKLMEFILMLPILSSAVYAWLNWLFIGSVRVWICCMLPKSWRPPLNSEDECISRADLLSLSEPYFRDWLSANGEAPALLVKLLSCYVCMSHWVAFFFGLIFFPWENPSPLNIGVWFLFYQAAAGIGLAAFSIINKITTQTK